MSARLQRLGCVMTLTAMLAPWAVVVRTAVHLAFDAHHHEGAAATRDDHDGTAVLHGHAHAHGTPAHSHDATLAVAGHQVPAPSLILHPSLPTSTFTATVAEAILLPSLDPSPPPRAPIILRI